VLDLTFRVGLLKLGRLTGGTVTGARGAVMRAIFFCHFKNLSAAVAAF